MGFLVLIGCFFLTFGLIFFAGYLINRGGDNADDELDDSGSGWTFWQP